MLWIGIRWQSETPMAVEAEIWSPQPREAAPRPQPEPEPDPVKKPEPKPEPKPVVKEPPKPVEKPIDKPDIALEQEKKRKEKERQERLAEQERQEKLKLKAEQERQEKLKKQAEDARLAKLAEAEEKKKKEAEAQKKAALEKKRKQEAAEAEMVAKARDEEMRRLTGSVTGTGGMGDAPKSQGGRADASYIQKVGAKIRSNTIFAVPDNLDGNPAVEYAVELLPDGSVRGLRLRKSSGVAGFDEAVKRAIEKSQPFPPDKSGTAPAGFTVSHRPKDQ